MNNNNFITCSKKKKKRLKTIIGVTFHTVRLASFRFILLNLSPSEINIKLQNSGKSIKMVYKPTCA